MTTEVTQMRAAGFSHVLDNLGEAEQKLIRVLGERGPTPKAELCEAANLGRWKGNMAITRLDSLGLVTWDEDGRAKRYSLTQLGAQMYDELCRTARA